MDDAATLKVFISWSGDLSLAVALALREWLSSMFETVRPFVSDKDIEPGARSWTTLETELEGTSFGLLVLTQENQHSPWLHFEAGALSKEVSREDTRVVPLLVDIASPSNVPPPLGTFQAKRLDKAGIKSIVEMLCNLTDVSLVPKLLLLDAMWPRLEEAVETAKQNNLDAEGSPPRDRDDVIDEILQIVRVLRNDIAESSHRAAMEAMAERRRTAPPDDMFEDAIALYIELDGYLRRQLRQPYRLNVTPSPQGLGVAVATDQDMPSEVRERVEALARAKGAVSIGYEMRRRRRAEESLDPDGQAKPHESSETGAESENRQVDKTEA